MSGSGVTRSLFAGLIGVSLAACGGGGDAPAGGDTAGAAATTPAATVTDPATIRGVINFTGTAPANAAIDMSQEATCAAKHSTPTTAETVVANNGKLKNVFVYVKEGVTGTHAPPSTPVEIDQNGCVYSPHVIGVMAGQPLAFKNSDGILHNVKSTPVNQPTFNLSQPNNMTSTRTLNVAEVMVPIQCDVHGWMQAYVGVVDHPYFSVSGDDGSFTIANLPAGTYTIEAWHEKYGPMTQQVTVAANETKDVTFDYNAAMAGAYVPMADPIDPHGTHGTKTKQAGAPAGAQ